MAGVGIHSTTAGERIAKAIFAGLGWQFASGYSVRSASRKTPNILPACELNGGF